MIATSTACGLTDTSVPNHRVYDDTSTYQNTGGCDKIDTEKHIEDWWDDIYPFEQLKWLSYLHGKLKEIIVTYKARFRVIRQPRPISNFKAWRYKR